MLITKDFNSKKRTLRLQKKLKVGVYQELIYSLECIILAPPNTNDNNKEAVDLVEDTFDTLSLETNASFCYTTQFNKNDGTLLIDGIIEASAKISKEEIIKALKNCDTLIKVTLYDGKCANWCEIWSDQDCFNYEKYWTPIYQK